MLILICAIIALGFIAALASRYKGKKTDTQCTDSISEKEDLVCCGMHEVCEKDSLIAASSPKIEYFDDEELDELRKIPAEYYTEEQTILFQEIFETLPENEVAAWIRSLQLREIELPLSIREEVLFIISDRRNNH